ncbi:MAG TPA: bifunctional hydroxymethylpyrimidine kinase/phosphomethylpyrimidine kinase [Prosthecobacter sp.]|nr:bifunctional hydroxymethylpyrimidine kinase/phosphomethylpyrimidine kinase [Prosthecobacter sp.]
MHLPPVLTIAGSDSSAGAGIQADLKAISALGGYALTALTSVVSETPGRVSKVRLLEPEFVADQIRVLFRAFPIRAAKTGMLGGRDQVIAVVETWRECAGALPLVVDPVMVATGGGRLLEEDAIEVISEQLLSMATLITPNMDEAAVLWGRQVPDREAMGECAAELAQRYSTAVLVKGGHLADGSVADVLCAHGKLRWYEAQRTAGVKTHGTGCTYSAAIAASLAGGLGLEDAISRAKAYIARAIAQHFTWEGDTGTVQALNHLQQELV